MSTQEPFLTVACTGEAETARLGARLAVLLEGGDVVALAGPLGVGKSVLARAVIRTRMQDPDLAVPSPSFTLVQIYEPTDGPALWHVDLYRIADPGELEELGLEEAADAIAIVEWAEHAGDALPGDRLDIRFEPEGATLRRLVFSGSQAWRRRLQSMAVGA